MSACRSYSLRPHKGSSGNPVGPLSTFVGKGFDPTRVLLEAWTTWGWVSTTALRPHKGSSGSRRPGWCLHEVSELRPHKGSSGRIRFNRTSGSNVALRPHKSSSGRSSRSFSNQSQSRGFDPTRVLLEVFGQSSLSAICCCFDPTRVLLEAHLPDAGSQRLSELRPHKGSSGRRMGHRSNW